MSDFDLFSIAYSELKLCYLYPLRLFLIRDYNNQLNLLYKRYKLFICLYLIMINIFLRWFCSEKELLLKPLMMNSRTLHKYNIQGIGHFMILW